MSFIPESPPPEATAEVEQTAQGTQITLRPRGWERCPLVGFVVVWVIGSLVSVGRSCSRGAGDRAQQML